MQKLVWPAIGGAPAGAPFLNLGVAQLAERVIWDHEAGSSSLPTQTTWPVGQAVKTPDLHSGNAGSTPVPATKKNNVRRFQYDAK